MDPTTDSIETGLNKMNIDEGAEAVDFHDPEDLAPPNIPMMQEAEPVQEKQQEGDALQNPEENQDQQQVPSSESNAQQVTAFGAEAVPAQEPSNPAAGFQNMNLDHHQQLYQAYCELRYAQMIKEQPELQEDTQAMSEIMLREFQEKAQNPQFLAELRPKAITTLQQQQRQTMPLPNPFKLSNRRNFLTKEGLPTLETLRDNGKINLIDYPDLNEEVTEKPRKYLHPYLIFVKANRAEVKIKYPEMSFKQCSQKLSEMWNSISAFERAEYQLLSDEDKQNREVCMEKFLKWQARHPKNQWMSKKKAKELRKNQAYVKGQIDFLSKMHAPQGLPSLPPLPTEIPPPGPEQTMFFMQLLAQQQHYIQLLLKAKNITLDCPMPKINPNMNIKKASFQEQRAFKPKQVSHVKKIQMPNWEEHAYDNFRAQVLTQIEAEGIDMSNLDYDSEIRSKWGSMDYEQKTKYAE